MSRIGSKVVGGLASLRVVELNRQTRKPANRQTKKGFTLVEVMVTIAILAIGLIGILRAYSSLLNAAGVSYEYIDAVCLAKEKMVEIELGELQDKAITKGTVRGEASGIYADFKWEQTIESSDNKKLNIANVIVFKKDDVKSRRFTLVTYAYSKE